MRCHLSSFAPPSRSTGALALFCVQLSLLGYVGMGCQVGGVQLLEVLVPTSSGRRCISTAAAHPAAPQPNVCPPPMLAAVFGQKGIPVCMPLHVCCWCCPVAPAGHNRSVYSCRGCGALVNCLSGPCAGPKATDRCTSAAAAAYLPRQLADVLTAHGACCLATAACLGAGVRLNKCSLFESSTCCNHVARMGAAGTQCPG